jgi:hypothetical protein
LGKLNFIFDDQNLHGSSVSTPSQSTATQGNRQLGMNYHRVLHISISIMDDRASAAGFI